MGLSASPGTAQTAEDTTSAPLVEIPLRLVGGWLVVPGVTGRGDTLDLILDTGAAQGGITRALATRLGLEAADNVAAYGASGTARMDLVDLPPIFVGGIDVGSRRALVIADSVLVTEAGEPIAGIIGAPFLRRFDALIDAPGGVLRLYERGAAPEELEEVLAPENGVPFRLSGTGLINLDVAVNGQVARGVFDTGARRLIVNWPTAKLAGIETSEDPLSERKRGVGNEVVRAYGGRIDRLELGPTRWESIDAEIADLPIFRLLGLGERPTLLLGAPVIRGCPVLISYAARTLRFCRRPG